MEKRKFQPRLTEKEVEEIKPSKTPNAVAEFESALREANLWDEEDVRDIIRDVARDHLGIDDIFETPGKDLDATAPHFKNWKISDELWDAVTMAIKDIGKPIQLQSIPKAKLPDVSAMNTETMELQNEASQRYAALQLLLEQTMKLPSDHPVKPALSQFIEKDYGPKVRNLEYLNFDVQIETIKQLVAKLFEIRKNAGVVNSPAK